MSGWPDIGRLNPREKSGYRATGRSEQEDGSGFLAIGGDRTL